jgi:hypothetical protein
VIDPEAQPAGSGTRATKAPWRDLPILIVIIAGLVHFIRGAEVDGLVFVTLGVALTIASLRDRHGTPRERRPVTVEPPAEPLGPLWISLAVLICVAYGLVVGQWSLAGPAMIMAVLLPGLLFVPLAWRVRRKGESAGSGKWIWAAVLSGLCLWELNSFLYQPTAGSDSYDHPTLSAVLNPWFQSAAVRAILLTVWLGVGLWLARRFFVTPREEEE